MSSSDSALIAKQKELLMEKLADFETTNRALRHLLRDQHRQEAGSVRLEEQRDVLLKKLGEQDESNQRLRIDLMDRDRYVAELKAHGAAQRVSVLSGKSLKKCLERSIYQVTEHYKKSSFRLLCLCHTMTCHNPTNTIFTNLHLPQNRAEDG
jgi:outer dense fiber protein 2